MNIAIFSVWKLKWKCHMLVGAVTSAMTILCFTSYLLASCEISRTAGYFGKKLYSFAIFYLLNTKVLLIDEASPWRRDIDCN